MNTIVKGIAAGVVGFTVLVVPVAAHAGTTVSPAQQTCAAYKAWLAHPSTARLNAMLTASENAPYKYVGEDAVGLYKDVRSGKTTYLAKDEAYFAKDC